MLNPKRLKGELALKVSNTVVRTTSQKKEVGRATLINDSTCITDMILDTPIPTKIIFPI